MIYLFPFLMEYITLPSSKSFVFTIKTRINKIPMNVKNFITIYLTAKPVFKNDQYFTVLSKYYYYYCLVLLMYNLPIL